LSEAGLSVRDMQLINTATGEPFTVEFLLDNPGYERFTLFTKRPSNGWAWALVFVSSSRPHQALEVGINWCVSAGPGLSRPK
jgi:hypothetical protein